MKTRAIIAAALSLTVATGAYAQDKIFQSNGNVIEAKIKVINGDNIIYRHWNDRNGTQFSISLKEVDKVKYENGVEERFNGENNGQDEGRYARNRNEVRMRGNETVRLGSSIYSISPIQFTENGFGVAVSYEKAIDKTGIVSFILPVMATFNLNNHEETIYDKHQDAMFYFSPGLKFYPTSMFGKVKYAIGPSLVVGAGEKTRGGEYYYGYNPSYDPYYTQTKFMLGILVNNSLNFNPSEHLYMGMDLGFGFTYINRLGGINQGISGMVQGGFKIGYRL